MHLFYLTAAYLAGLLAARVIGPPAWHAVLPALLAAVWLPLRRGRAGPWLLGLLLLGCGYSNYHLHLTPPSPVTALNTLPDNTTSTFFGRLRHTASRPDGGKRLDLQVHHILRNRQPVPISGGLRLYIDSSERSFASGAELAVRARLRIPRRYGTPGEFDFPHYLAANGLQATAFVPDDSGIALLADAAPSLPDRLRATAGCLIDRSIAKPQRAALVRALVIGDKDGLPERQRRRLADLGLSHLFSISGFHLGLVAMFGYLTLLAVVRRSERLMLTIPPRRLLPILLIPLLWAYLQLTGQGMPTMRAWLAAAVVAGLLWMRRCCRPVHAALAVAGAVLAAAPMALFLPSFQLSFAGVFGILILVPRWSAKLPDLPARQRRLLQLLLVTPAATVTTAPLVLWHFHMVAPAGIPANLAAGMLVGWLAVPLGLTGLILTPLWPAGAAGCFRGTAAIIDLTLRLCEQLLRLPLLAPRHLYLSAASLLLIALMAGVILMPPRRWRLPVLLALLAALCLWPIPRPATLRVIALSVGQGDSLLVSDADGHHYLIDGGGSPRGSFDTGERLVAPALGRLGVRELTAVVLSHDHPDHRNGLLHIVRHFRVRAFWCAMPRQDLWPPLRRVLEQRRIPIRTFAPGWSIVSATGGHETAVFVPPQTTPNVNDRSLAFYARHRHAGVLLTGDLEETGVRHLVKATPARPVTLLKLSHHGARNGNAPLLLEHFSPSTVFACLGYQNHFGFPHARTLDSVAQEGLFLCRTDLHGTLSFTPHDAGWHVRTWQKGLFR